jgi:hypothetical protein
MSPVAPTAPLDARSDQFMSLPAMLVSGSSLGFETIDT